MTEEKSIKNIEPTFKKAEGKFESVGVQNGNPYIVIDGKKISCSEKDIMKVEIIRK